MLCNFHFIWVFSMKIIKKLILAETWLLCLRNLCWALQKVDKHETLEAWKNWMLIPGVGFSPFCNSTKFANNFVYPRISKLENFFNQNEFHFSVIFFSFVYTKKNWKDGGWEREEDAGNQKLSMLPFRKCRKILFHFSQAGKARQAQWGKFSRHSQPQAREQREHSRRRVTNT